MQTYPNQNLAELAGTQETALQRAARLLPGPHSAQEQAARAAAITVTAPKSRAVAARFLIGTMAIAVAVTIPDLSAGAMDSPYLRVQVREPSTVLKQPIWSPSAGATAPVYATAMAAEAIAPTSLTYGKRADFAGADRMVPLRFLETGSERFDLAFAGVEMPSPVAFTISGGFPDRFPEQGRTAIGATTAPLRARLIDIPQITNVRNFAPSPAPEVRHAGPPLAAESPVERSVAAANESVAAAFAGPLDVSGGVRDSLPDAGAQQAAVAAALPASPSSVSASREAQAVLELKSQLDARVNGVVTGSVDFQQQDGTIAIRLGSVVDLLRDRFSASEIDRLSGSGAMGSFVTLAELQDAGIPISYDPVYDELEFGIDYDDAPQAAKVQMEQIGGPTLGSSGALIDQIPR